MDMSQQNRIRVLYEIAMVIGNSTDLTTALKQILTTMLRKLDATLIAVYAASSTDPLKVIPTRGLTEAHQQLCNTYLHQPLTNQYQFHIDWIANKPVHCLMLPQFGVLLIERNEAIDTETLLALEPICRKLVTNIMACYDSNRLKEQEKILQQSVIDLKRAQEAKDLFLANMSHEIRTPLNGIIGFLGQLEQTKLDEEQQKFLSIIDHSANSLLGIINDILDFSKIESGNLSIEAIPVNIVQLVTPLAELFRARSAENGSQLVLKLDQACPQAVLSDPLRLKQIISNFLSNAVKFTKNGTVTLSVSCRIEGENARINVMVSDTGIGIAPDRLAKLCQPFTQADASISRQFGGTGLGLSISKSLIDMMSGTLHISSELGKGSHFGFELSLPTAEVVEKPKNIIQDFSAELLQDKHLLVVEDNIVNQMLMKAVLKKLNIHNYDMLANGAEAVEAAKEQRYDLILMDIHMPVMGGEDAVQHIRALEKEIARHPTPILALTANALQGDAEHYKSLGMNDVITKPLDIEILKYMLNLYLIQGV